MKLSLRSSPLGAVPVGLVVVALVVALAVTAWRWRQPTPASANAPTPAPTAEGATPAPAPPPAAPQQVEAASAPLGEYDVAPALVELFGSPAVIDLFEADSFAHRVAATVDNLGREHAPISLWPLKPTVGRFSVATREGHSVVAAENFARYEPVVSLLETTDTQGLVALYLRLYPLLQSAYAELGFPKRYFNERLLEVIDQLLATPEPSGPIALQLTEVKGPVPATRPWLHYTFADPALEALSAGQKILLRIGPDNERRVKRKLAEFRRELGLHLAPH